MVCKDMLEIYFKLTDRFDFLWYFYTFFIVAVGGYFVSTPDLQLSFTNSVIIIVGYSFFVIMNIFALVVTSKSLRIVSDAIYFCVASGQQGDIGVIKAVVRRNHHLDNLVTFVVHGIMFFLVTVMVILR